VRRRYGGSATGFRSLSIGPSAITQHGLATFPGVISPSQRWCYGPSNHHFPSAKPWCCASHPLRLVRIASFERRTGPQSAWLSRSPSPRPTSVPLQARQPGSNHRPERNCDKRPTALSLRPTSSSSHLHHALPNPYSTHLASSLAGIVPVPTQ